jgi:hypothetical protein
MFFIKIIPLLVHTMIIKSKSKGLGNPQSYSVSFILTLLIIHLIQIAIILNRLGLKLNSANFSLNIPPGISVLIMITVLVLVHFFVAKIYNRKRLGRWYVQYKGYTFMRYNKLIVFSYYFLNIFLIFILALYFNP